MKKLIYFLLVLILLSALCITSFAATEGTPEQPDYIKTVLICFGLGVVIGLVVVLIMKSKLKTVRHQSGADAYTDENKLVLTASADVFCYQTVTRHERPKPDDKK